MEVLSQEEVDQLLAAIKAGDTESENLRPAFDCRKIKIYDFKRPDKFSKEQIRTMCILHETFARHTTFILTSQFKIPCHVHVASVDQLMYEEFIRSIPTPATMAILNMGNLLVNKILLEIDPAVSFGFINHAFGGKDLEIKCQHELTQLEWVVMKDVIGKLMNCLAKGWEPIVPDIEINIDHVDTVPQFVNIAHPNDMTIMVTFEVKIGSVEGMINICYPYDCLNKVMDKLTAVFLYGADSVCQKKYKLVNRCDVPVEMTAEIFRRDYPIHKILDWKKEELLLPLTARVPNTCYLRFDKSRIFHCEIIVDNKWFPKKVEIIGISEQPRGTEGKMELNTNPAVAEALAEAGITISVELGRTAKTINEILKMGEGTIVELDKLAGEPVDIKANGVLIAKGEMVVIDENFGVRVTEIVKAIGTLSPPDGLEGR
jgi:flagellar motor switch protein FliM